MSKKLMLIISIVVIVLIAGIATTALILTHGNNTGSETPDPAGIAPGDSVSLEQTPAYGSCATISAQSIRDAFNVLDIDDGKRTGIIATNYETADVCSYGYASAENTKSIFRTEIYLLTATKERQETENIDVSWRNISSIAYPEYTLTYPANFKVFEKDQNKEYTLQINSGNRNYRFVVARAATITTPDEESTLKSLLTLASGADYTTGANDDVPPAPQV